MLKLTGVLISKNKMFSYMKETIITYLDCALEFEGKKGRNWK